MTMAIGSLKHCSHCGRELPTAAFNKNKNTPDGLHYWCRDCIGEAYKTRKRPGTKLSRYSYEELSYRPIEHALEVLTCLELAEAWLVDKTTAGRMRSRYWEYAGTPLELNDERMRQLRRWLERKAKESSPENSETGPQ